MKPDKQAIDDKLEKELKRMKRKLDSENIALHKILTGSKSIERDNLIPKSKTQKANP